MDPDDADPQKYIPREVDWFPRKGVDFVPLEANMPLRTWTFSSNGRRLLTILTTASAQLCKPLINSAPVCYTLPHTEGRTCSHPLAFRNVFRWPDDVYTVAR